MDIQGIDKRRLTIQTIYYLVTLLCLGVLTWALNYLYRYFNVALVLWILLYIAIAAYIIGAIYITIKLKRGIHKVAFHSLALQLLPLVAAIVSFSSTPTPEEEMEIYTPLTGKPRTYERYFNDMQSVQKEAALRNGLAPFESQAAIEAQYKKLRRRGDLVRIETNPKYIVRDLTYSSPYVVPKVEELLEDIAEAFQKKTQSKSRFMVTSVLRTEEDIAKLRRVNGNASAASCHCNATTIDISYVRFGQDELRPRGEYELRLALAQTLHELRKEGRCYVKIERKQYCYHITVR